MATVGSNTEAKITMESHSAFEDKKSLSGNQKKKKKCEYIENLNVNRNIQIPCEYSYFIYLYSKSRKCNKYRRLFTSGDSNLQPSYICHWLKGCISWIVPWSGTYKHYIEQLPFPQKPLESMKLGKFPMKKHFHKGP